MATKQTSGLRVEGALAGLVVLLVAARHTPRRLSR